MTRHFGVLVVSAILCLGCSDLLAVDRGFRVSVACFRVSVACFWVSVACFRVLGCGLVRGLACCPNPLLLAVCPRVLSCGLSGGHSR